MAKEASNNKKKDVSKDKKNFGKDFKAELKKVSWPTLKQLINNTTAVIVIVLITAAIVFVLDVVFETLNKYGVENLKAIVTSNSTEQNTVDDNQQPEVTVQENSAEEENVEESSEETNTVTEEANTVETQNTVDR